MIIGKVHRIRLRIPIVGHVLLAVTLTCPRPPAFADERARLVDGRIVAGRITGQSPKALAFIGDAGDERIPLTSIRQINFDAPPRLASGTTPPRRISFRGGESLHAEVEALDARQVTISAFGDRTSRIQRSALLGVSQPAGERVIAFDDFEGGPALFDGARYSAAQHRSGSQSLALRPTDAPAVCLFPRPPASGRVVLSFYDTGALNRTHDWLIEAEFARSESTSRFEFHPGWSDAIYRSNFPDAGRLSQDRLRRSAGWHRFTLLFDAERTLALVDEAVAARGSGVGPLTALRVRTAAALQATGGADSSNRNPVDDHLVEAWVDDVQVFEQVVDRPAPVNTQHSDLVRFADGVELFGEVLSADPRAVVLAGRFGSRRLPWPELSGLEFAAGGGPVGHPVDGLVAKIDLAPIPGADALASDTLTAALQSASDTEIVVYHPYLGRLRIPRRQVERIVPQFSGSLWLVDAAHHHFGNEIREDFNAKLAEGPAIEWSLLVETAPRQGAHVSLLAAELEPGSSRAPRDGRFLADVVAGHLRTLLFINGRRVDDLNRHVSLRSLPANPQRLRIPVPPGLLKPGMNTIRIEQRPSRDDPREFDDCEISRLAIEIEP